MNDEWLLETLRYYGPLHFFEQYRNLADNELLDTVRGLSLRIGDLYGIQQQQDWAVLMVDKQRVIKIAFDMIYDSVCLIELPTALRELKHLSQISRGFFYPENITAHYITYENEKIYTWKDLITYFDELKTKGFNPFYRPYLRYKTILEFELKYIKYSLVGHIDTSIVAGQINYLVKDSGYEFVLYDMSSTSLLMFLNQEEKQTIQSERGLNLRDVEHRVFATTFTPNEHELSQKSSWFERF